MQYLLNNNPPKKICQQGAVDEILFREKGADSGL
jgi:hypothetical protein